MQCYYLNRTGHLCRRHCIFYQCQGCGNRFGKEWQHRSRIALGSWSGELESGIYKQAQKDAKKLASSNLRDKAQELLDIIQTNPFQNPPPYEKLVGDLEGAYSRRINIQHRLVYEVIESENTVKILRMFRY